ncbi:Uncharacterized protein Rs2_04815 [Raphanus sativus]|nr:Uncharacterized protein Rs2_04815 [Raphanus sativus]
MPRMHNGRVGTQGYIREQYRVAEGNWVLPMFREPEEQYRKLPLGCLHEQTVGRKVMMPHFERMAMEKRILQGHATFQFSSEGEFPRKWGCPSKAPSAAGEPPRAFTGMCQCRALFQNTQRNRSVVEYTEDFINQAKL